MSNQSTIWVSIGGKMDVWCQGKKNVVGGETYIFLGVERCVPSSWSVVTQFPNPIHDTWEPLARLTGSEHMIQEFNKKWEQDYLIKTAETLQVVTVRRNSTLEKNTKKVSEGQTLPTLRRQWEKVEVMTTKMANLRTKMRMGRELD